MLVTSVAPRPSKTASNNFCVAARWGFAANRLAVDRETPVDLERYFNQQNIARYRKLLELVSDQTQRRQIMNLLEEEEYELARYADAPTLAPIMKL
jgi:hypothetical protein